MADDSPENDDGRPPGRRRQQPSPERDEDGEEQGRREENRGQAARGGREEGRGQSRNGGRDGHGGRDGRGPQDGRGRGDGNGLFAALQQMLITNVLNPRPAQPAPPPPPPAPNFEHDTVQPITEGEQLLGMVYRDRVLQIAIHVRPTSDTLAADAERLASDPLANRTPIPHAEYAAKYGLQREDVARVVRYYTLQHGLQFVPNWGDRLRRAVPDRVSDRTVYFRGTAADLNRAFGIRLFRVRGKDGGLYRTYLGGLKVPSELAGHIGNVYNLDNRDKAAPRLRLARPLGRGAPSMVGHTPMEIAQAYSFPSGSGQGQTIAILELGGGLRFFDLLQYFRGLGLQVPKIQTIGVGGASNAPTGDPTGPDGEVTLDIEVAGAIANGANYAMYFAPNSSAGFWQGINAAIHDAANKPSILSISWGGPEPTWSRAEMYSITEAFQAAALMGISVFVAAGDSGSTDGVSASSLNVDFPASSPWATACGGTSLYMGAGAPPEKVWNDGDAGGSGGGISAVFTVPSFQTGMMYQSAPLSGRGLPDVAGCADPNTGYKVRIDGVDEVFGGTSAVAPLWAALTALLNQSIGMPLGFLNPLLYRTNLKRALNDITIGDNNTTHLAGNYNATVGWDPCSGFGSPNGAAILATLT
jgi:kumamolisin